MTLDQLKHGLLKENNDCVKRLMTEDGNINENLNEIRIDFNHILFQCRGFLPRLDILDLICRISYNHCYSSVLSKLMAPEQRKFGVGCQTSTSSFEDWQLDDTIIFLSEILKVKGEVICAGILTSDFPGWQHLVQQLSLYWLPAATKVVICQLLAVCILGWIHDGNITKAIELCTTLLKQVAQWTQDALLRDDDMQDVCHMLPLTTRHCNTKAYTSVSDVVNLLLSLAHFIDNEWQSTLTDLEHVQSVDFYQFCCYLKGVVLYKLNELSSAEQVISSAYRDSYPDGCLQLAALDHLGDCFAAQGKHQSAIQMYKQYMMKNCDNFLPLYKISVQYRQLGYTDAEVEALQLLVELLNKKHNKMSPRRPSTEPHLLSVDNMMACVALGQQQITELEAVYILANRFMELHRYTAASKLFNRILHLLTEGGCNISVKCITRISVPSVINLYMNSVAAHIEAALYDEAVILCDTILSKCASFSLDCNVMAACTLLQSKQHNAVSHRSVEFSGAGSGFTTDSDSILQLINNELIVPQTALYKTEALLQLGRADEALLCVDSAIADIERYAARVTHQPALADYGNTCAGDSDITRSHWQILLSDAYDKKRKVLPSARHSSSAVHFGRLSAALTNE